MGLREGWTQEMVESFMMESKELQKLAAELDMIVIPTWLDEDGMRENLIEQYMIKEPELSEEEMMKKVEETVNLIENWDKLKGIETKKEYFEWALTDPERVRNDLYQQYKEVYPEKPEEEIREEIREKIENITEGAYRRFERLKKYGNLKA